MLVKYEGIVSIFNKNIHKSHSWAFLGSHTIFKHDPLANIFIFRPVITYKLLLCQVFHNNHTLTGSQRSFFKTLRMEQTVLFSP